MSTVWTSRYALRTSSVKSSTIRELLKIAQNPEIISLPAVCRLQMFSAASVSRACRIVLDKKAVSALQYGATEGYDPLREMIAANISRYGIGAKIENVLISSGSPECAVAQTSLLS